MPEELLPRVVLLPDEPIADWHADKLDTARIAKVIASAAHHTESPFTIGVFGRWGQGKTSVLRQVESLIADNYKDDVTVWFNAWQYEREEVPIVPLILAIAEKLEKQTKDDSQAKEYLHKTGRILRGIARAVSLSISTPLPVGLTMSVSGKELTDEISEAVKDSPPEILPTTFYMKAFNALTECANELRRNIQTEDSPLLPRLIVFIDDLDRCLPERAVGLLEGIKLVLNQPGFVFILGLDRQILEDHLVKIYKEAGSKNPTENGRRFIDKIIQLPLPLPRHDDLAGYIEKLFERRELKQEENKPIVEVLRNIKEIIAVGANANPRNVVRFINNLIVDRTLWIAAEEKPNLVDEKLLGVGAVSRILREHLGESKYIALSSDDELCEELSATEAGMSVDLDWTETPNPEVLSSRKRLRHEVLQRLDEAPFLQELLTSKFGKLWLTNYDLRVKVDRFLHRERGDNEGPSPQQIARQAILAGKRVPLNEEDLKRVIALDFSATSITDDNLSLLKDLKRLGWLNLAQTSITDAGLASIGALIHLESLSLRGTNTSCEGLTYLTRLIHLRWLDLSACNIKDTALEYLKPFSRLRTLNLNGTMITNDGLRRLRLQPLRETLQSLDLSQTKIDDAALNYLSSFRYLAMLDLTETRTTPEGRDTFNKFLPTCLILA